MENIQRIASFFFDLPEGGTPPSALFVVFGMARQSSPRNCPVKLNSTAIENASCGTPIQRSGLGTVPHRDFLNGPLELEEGGDKKAERGQISIAR